MKTAEVTEVLNDLIIINNDRVEGYRKAIDELGSADSDLKTLFERFIDNSKANISQLSAENGNYEKQHTGETTNSGKLYRSWMGIKKTFAMDNRLAVLESCEFGEDAALKTYNQALEDNPGLPESVETLILNQRAQLKENHDYVKRLRDAEKAAKN